MAPTRVAAIPLKTLNQNIQQSMLLDGSATKQMYASTSKSQPSSHHHQQQQQHHRDDYNHDDASLHTKYRYIAPSTTNTEENKQQYYCSHSQQDERSGGGQHNHHHHRSSAFPLPPPQPTHNNNLSSFSISSSSVATLSTHNVMSVVTKPMDFTPTTNKTTTAAAAATNGVHYQDPFQDPSTQFRQFGGRWRSQQEEEERRKRQRQQQQQANKKNAAPLPNSHITANTNINTAATATSNSSNYYDTLFSQTNVDDLFADDSTTADEDVTHKNAFHHQQRPKTVPLPVAMGASASVPSSMSSQAHKSILVKEGKFGNSNPSSRTQSQQQQQQQNSLGSQRSSRRGSVVTIANTAADPNASIAEAFMPTKTSSFDNAASSVDAYAKQSYFDNAAKTNGGSRSRSHSRGVLLSSINTINTTNVGVANGAAINTTTAPTNNNATTMAAMHPAARARCASRSVAIPDDAPAMLLPSSRRNTNTNIASFPQHQQHQQPLSSVVFTPARQTFSMSTNNHHNHSHHHHQQNNHSKVDSKKGNVNVSSAPSSCVKVGGTFVAAADAYFNTLNNSSNSAAAFNGGVDGGAGRVRTAMPSVAAYNNNANGNGRRKRGRSADDGGTMRSLSRGNSVASNPNDGCSYSYEDQGTFGGAFASTKRSVGGVSAYSQHIPTDGSDCFGSHTMTGTVALPPQLRALLGDGEMENANASSTAFPPSATTNRRRTASAAVTADGGDADIANTSLHTGFTAKPLWSLVGTYKTALQHIVDLRGGVTMRWVQRNPKGGHQRLTVPLNMIQLGGGGNNNAHNANNAAMDGNATNNNTTPHGGSGIAIIRVDAPAPPNDDGDDDGYSTMNGTRRARSGRSRSMASSTTTATATNASSSVYSSQFGRHRPPLEGNHALPSYLKGRGGGARSDTAHTSNASWAVVIKTVNMRPSQVTFGFGSAIEAHRFKVKLVEMVQNAQQYM